MAKRQLRYDTECNSQYLLGDNVTALVVLTTQRAQLQLRIGIESFDYTILHHS